MEGNESRGEGRRRKGDGTANGALETDTHSQAR